MINWGQQHVPTGVVATIMGFVPLVTASMAHFFLKDERFTLMTGIGIAVGFAGILVLFGGTDLMALGKDTIAQLAVLIAATGYAVTNILARKAGDNPTRTVGFGAMWIGTALMLPAALAEGHAVSHLDWEVAGAVLYLGVVSTALPTILLLHLVRTVGATFTAYANYLVPVIGVFLGVAFLDEALTASALIALGLILAGIALGQMGKGRR
jgi:drug/metabolite transporter (DMT)-like permease